VKGYKKSRLVVVLPDFENTF